MVQPDLLGFQLGISLGLLSGNRHLQFPPSLFPLLPHFFRLQSYFFGLQPLQQLFFASTLSLLCSVSRAAFRFSRSARRFSNSSSRRRTAALPPSEAALLELPSERGICDASRASRIRSVSVSTVGSASIVPARALSRSSRRSGLYPALPSFAAKQAVLIFLSCFCVSGGKRFIIHHIYYQSQVDQKGTNNTKNYATRRWPTRLGSSPPVLHWVFLTRVTLDCSLTSYQVGQYPYGSISTTNTINIQSHKNHTQNKQNDENTYCTQNYTINYTIPHKAPF